MSKEEVDAALARARLRETERVERPTHYEKQNERERPDMSSWSGASAGGGVWAGRSRSE